MSKSGRIGDGNSGGWSGSKLSMNSFLSSCFSACDRKNLIADANMHRDFQSCKRFGNLFFSTFQQWEWPLYTDDIQCPHIVQNKKELKLFFTFFRKGTFL